MLSKNNNLYHYLQQGITKFTTHLKNSLGNLSVGRTFAILKYHPNSIFVSTAFFYFLVFKRRNGAINTLIRCERRSVNGAVNNKSIISFYGIVPTHQNTFFVCNRLYIQ